MKIKRKILSKAVIFGLAFNPILSFAVDSTTSIEERFKAFEDRLLKAEQELQQAKQEVELAKQQAIQATNRAELAEAKIKQITNNEDGSLVINTVDDQKISAIETRLNKVEENNSAILAKTEHSTATKEKKDGPLEGIEFHGYFRSGNIFSVEDDWKRAKYPSQKETLGRLGIESDNWYELVLTKTFELDNGQKIAIKTRAGADNEHDAGNNQLGSNVNSNTMGIMETYVEFEGISETGKIWGGKRFYGKEHLVFMTDFFYTDWSGTGIGITDYEINDVAWSLGYLASDKNNDDDGRWGSDTNNTMHMIHLGAKADTWELHFAGKYLPDNTNYIQGKEGATSDDWAESGFELTGVYKMKSFFNLGNGFSELVGQAGVGLGAGQLLGRSIHVGGAYTNVGSARSKYGKSSGLQYETKEKDEDWSARLVAWGGYFLDNGTNIFPSIQYQYNDHEEGDEDYVFSAMARTTTPLVGDNFFLATETGYVYDHVGAYTDDGGNDFSTVNNDVFKFTIAPTWTINTGIGPAPEVRLLGTYLNNSGSNDGHHDFLIGMQADMWW